MHYVCVLTWIPFGSVSYPLYDTGEVVSDECTLLAAVLVLVTLKQLGQ